MNTQQSGKTLKTIRPKLTERMYEFSDSEALTQCIVTIYRKENYRNLESSLYKMPDCYRLIIKSAKNYENLFCTNEFCQQQSSSTVLIGVTKEYGKALIEKKAIRTFGKAFSPKP